MRQKPYMNIRSRTPLWAERAKISRMTTITGCTILEMLNRTNPVTSSQCMFNCSQVNANVTQPILTHVFANVGIVKWWPAVPNHFARAGVVFESLNFWGHVLCSVKGDNPNGIDDVGWSWVFDFFLLNDDQLCLITLRVRSSYLRVWTFEATFYAQWKLRILMALTMLAEVEFSIFCF